MLFHQRLIVSTYLLSRQVGIYTKNTNAMHKASIMPKEYYVSAKDTLISMPFPVISKAKVVYCQSLIIPATPARSFHHTDSPLLVDGL